MTLAKPLPLPDETVRPISAGDLARTVVSTLLAFILVNLLFVWILWHHTPNPGHRIIRAKWWMLEELDDSVDSLILGDSAGNQAVMPSILAEELGPKWVNLCTVAHLLVANDVWMLQTYIDKHGPPRRVVVSHVYDMWARPPRPEVFAQVPLPWGFWERRDPGFELDRFQVFLTRYVPVYSAGHSLRVLIMQPWKLVRDDLELGSDGFLTEREASPEGVQSNMRRRHLPIVRRRSVHMSEINLKALHKLIDLAEQHHFELYLANGPIYEGLFQEPAFHVYYAKVQRSLAEAAARSEHVHVVLKDVLTFPDTQLQNVDHLTLPGAKTYSRRLAEAIREIEERPAPGSVPSHE